MPMEKEIRGNWSTIWEVKIGEMKKWSIDMLRYILCYFNIHKLNKKPTKIVSRYIKLIDQLFKITIPKS